MSIGAAQVRQMFSVQVGKKGIINGANILSFAILSELQLAGNVQWIIVLPEKKRVKSKSWWPEEVFKTLF